MKIYKNQDGNLFVVLSKGEVFVYQVDETKNSAVKLQKTDREELIEKLIKKIEYEGIQARRFGGVHT